MKHKQLFSFFTAAVLTVSGLFQNTAFSPAAQTFPAQAALVTANGSSGIGTVLSQRINADAAAMQTAECCSLFSADVSGQEATLHFQTDQNCRIVVGIYTDQYGDGAEKLIGNTITQVQNGQTTETVQFDFMLPEHYTLKAYMIGAGETLLSEEYVDQSHTREIEKLRLADISSFSADRVLNLDEKTDTNYMVYNDSVHVLSGNDSANIVVDADSETGHYVIQNLDKSIRKHETVAIENGSGDAVIFRVLSLKTENGITTVNADTDFNPSDAFDYIKIEYHPNRVFGEFHSQDADSVQAKPSSPLPSDAEDGPWSFSASTHLEPDIRAGLVQLPGMDTSFPMDTLEFSSTVSAAFDFEFLKTPHHDSSHFYMNLEYELGLALSAAGELELPLLTGTMIPDIAGSRLNFGLYLKMNLDGAVNGTMKLSTTLDETGFYPYAEYDMQTDSSFYAGITVRSNLTLPAEIRGNANLGLGLQASLSRAESHPNCERCLEGELDLTCNAAEHFDYHSGGKEIRSGTSYTAPRKKLTDIYYSDALGGFGFGICPNKHLSDITSSSGVILDPPQTTNPSATTETAPVYATTTELSMTMTSASETTMLTESIPGGVTATSLTNEMPHTSLTKATTSDTTYTTATTNNSAQQGQNDKQYRYLAFFKGNAPFDGYSVCIDSRYADEIIEIEIPSMYNNQPVTMIGDKYGSSGFINCQKLRKITLPETISEIGVGAFSGCSNLSKINLPDSITEIGAEAFFGCRSMSISKLPSNLRILGDMAFAECEKAFETLTFPPVLSEMGTAVFEGCRSIRSVTCSMRSLPEKTFSGCSGLESVKLSAPLRSIQAEAFSECTNLSNITLPSTLRTIGKEAFRNDTALSEITLPEGLTTIREDAFAAVPLLTIAVPSTAAAIDFSAILSAPQLRTVTIKSRTAEITMPDQAGYPQRNIQIYGYSGSTTDTFANTNHFSFVALDQQKPSEMMPAAGSPRTESYDAPHSVTFRNLKPRTLYNFYDLNGSSFTSGNLLYIGQGMSNDSGVLTFWYRPVKDNLSAAKYARSFDASEPAIEAYQRPSDLIGDVTLDNQIDISDAVMLARFNAEDFEARIESEGIRNADCNHDGKVNGDDVLQLLRYISKIIDRF